MPWIVGVDEAGYGPNLGPLVMTAVGCWVPGNCRVDLWRMLAAAVRRHDDPADGRIVVADSKQVYSPAQGLGELERCATAVLRECPATLHDLLLHLCPGAAAEMPTECWYTGTSRLPSHAEHAACQEATARFREACARKEVCFTNTHSAIVSPTAFNATVERWNSKGAVLAQALVELVRRILAADPSEEPIYFFVDKHGGRNHYAAALQDAFDDAMVVARAEGALQSVYQVLGGSRHVEVTFEPRAEERHFCVALASMLSKYLREVLMLEFNAFWQQKVPGLKATAGYPGDSRRYWLEIAGAVQELGVSEKRLWRCR